jgi:hypothetical protein
VSDSHRYEAKTNGFFISPYLQHLMARAGVSEVYSEADQLLETLLGVRCSRSQVFRVTHALGEALEDQPVAVPTLRLENNEVVYGSIDGSMLQTELGWKEVKLGRVFQARQLQAVGGHGRHRITESVYSACLGTCHEFMPRFEARLEPFRQAGCTLVFITDGAEWIRTYLQQHYPQATHILDYFHAYERLCDFAKLALPSEGYRQSWLAEQQARLYDGQVDEVIQHVEALTLFNKAARDERDKLRTYYRNNASRMAYGDYRQRGLMIGSGPMEAAHRTVLQARMKRSGQHWSIAGARSMINLRVVLKSACWEQALQPLLQAA